jgi:hypothetical protein
VASFSRISAASFPATAASALATAAAAAALAVSLCESALSTMASRACSKACCLIHRSIYPSINLSILLFIHPSVHLSDSMCIAHNIRYAWIVRRTTRGRQRACNLHRATRAIACAVCALRAARRRRLVVCLFVCGSGAWRANRTLTPALAASDAASRRSCNTAACTLQLTAEPAHRCNMPLHLATTQSKHANPRPASPCPPEDVGRSWGDSGSGPKWERKPKWGWAQEKWELVVTG